MISRRRVVLALAAGALASPLQTEDEVLAGGLISYGPNLSELFRHGADYVDKILNGAKPGDLPVGQPSVLDLVINMKTAHVLGVKIPQAILLRANKVIE